MHLSMNSIVMDISAPLPLRYIICWLDDEAVKNKGMKREIGC